ncbi:MAG: zinc ribbon domain-containing protein [Candidatus Abyssobacteria bacterium SURF_5]|uniref:Zinc ribbon domain-containing protein n=1 Tax=Abyssobacteria bacterium (strain SURF_5) TaxID=2093360 RepID=A0A3A4NSW4_ABYX5|nr:MAG: zinc ribbon domain-containing protein [Candidatus Abyssubacteria bacterium SURF_5]
MPLYDFKCNDCGEKSEVLIRTSLERESPSCSRCGSTNLERLISAPNIAREHAATAKTRCGKGSTCCGSTTPCEHPPCS